MEIVPEYIAGVIDGEGSILLARCHKKDLWRTPVVSVSSTTIELIDALLYFAGGVVCRHKTYKKHHKQSFSWRVTGRAAVDLCGCLKPLLLVPEKQHRANLIATDYVNCTPRNGKYTKAQIVRKQQFEYEIFHPSKP
jgi:hypothetical protein